MAPDRGTTDGVPGFASGSPGDRDVLLRLARALYEAVWVRDLRTGVVEVRTGFRLFGYAPGDIDPSVEWWLDRVHPEDRAEVKAAMDEALAAGAAGWSSAYRFRRRDGSWAQVVARAIIERDAQGAAIKAQGAMVDVSRLHEAEDALRDAERLLLDAQRIGQVRAWEEDLRSGAVLIDLAQLQGRPGTAQYASVPREEVFSRIHPGDMARLMELRQRTIQTGEPFETEYRSLEPGGERAMLVRGELERPSASSG